VDKPRVLVTGASGFIGAPCLPRLRDLGYEVHALSTRPRPDADGVCWHTADLLAPGTAAKLCAAVRPTHLLHLAWYVVPGKLVEAPENYDWVRASLELLQAFGDHAGQRTVFVGTGYEYDARYGYCSEALTPAQPDTVYGTCKNALRLLLESYARRNGLSAAWARVFFVYGPGEAPERLVPTVIRSLLEGQPARCSPGLPVRDYLHVADAADALVALLHSAAEGPFNVASGIPVTIRDLILAIGRKLNAPERVQLGAIPARPDDAPLIVADTTRLRETLAWRPRFDLDRGLDDTIDWWRAQRGFER
jgi:nucleoside-diphosphate-sugar epimerase